MQPVRWNESSLGDRPRKARESVTDSHPLSLLGREPRNDRPFQLKVRLRAWRKVKARCPPICGPGLSIKDSIG